MSILNRPYFRDEEAAHTFLESLVWPHGTECPHCGVIGSAYKIAANPAKRVRYGLWKCSECRKQFTCKVGTVFEHARVPLHKALQAAYLLCSSKKGVVGQFELTFIPMGMQSCLIYNSGNPQRWRY